LAPLDEVGGRLLVLGFREVVGEEGFPAFGEPNLGLELLLVEGGLEPLPVEGV